MNDERCTMNDEDDDGDDIGGQVENEADLNEIDHDEEDGDDARDAN